MTEVGAPPATSAGDWTAERIDAECDAAYESYFADIRQRHIAYFAERPELRSDTHPFAAKSREAALPDGWEHLARALPANAWHRHHLSGGSSQMLALVLLAAAARADASLDWIAGNLHLRAPLGLFEVELAPAVLNELPRQTTLDWLVLDRRQVIAAEAKFTERGLGQCSCEGRDTGSCSDRVLERLYWTVASRDMAIAAADGGCALSPAYQAVRNVAAAQALAGDRKSAFLLLYDARNPYFAGTGTWPGWKRMLSSAMSKSRTSFLSLSWQELLSAVSLDARVSSWAADKHGLVPDAR